MRFVDFFFSSNCLFPLRMRTKDGYWPPCRLCSVVHLGPSPEYHPPPGSWKGRTLAGCPARVCLHSTSLEDKNDITVINRAPVWTFALILHSLVALCYVSIRVKCPQLRLKKRQASFNRYNYNHCTSHYYLCLMIINASASSCNQGIVHINLSN